MSGRVRRFLGDSPLRVLLKLVVVSFLVGMIMSAFNLSPVDVVHGLRNVILDLWDTGFETIGRFFSHLVIGAVVVVPIYVVLRLISYRRG